ncbi:hypothetical protein [Phaeospirillum tilakii]|uniref:Uncharacterized protein n=1 Tax=Phaeospirillum tilakii TaxID=741673 RepID=A0ABW5CA88_9PROT
MSAAIPFPGAVLPARAEDGRGRQDAPPAAGPLAPALPGRTMALTLDGRTRTVAFAPDGAPRLQPGPAAGSVGPAPGADLPALLASRAAATTAAAVTESLLTLLAPPRR